MSKYIIKNCPACIYPKTCTEHLKNFKMAKDCKDINDCLLKQIVETCCDYVETSSYELAEEIIELLAIQECEE